jgi:gliding motility-associated-like protein
MKHLTKTVLCLGHIGLFLAFFCSFFFAPVFLQAQTKLLPGDLVVISVNANDAACSGNAVDRVSFVCFRDITPGTTIDITDNGWERLNLGKWGNSEGFVRVTRTGASIPARTVITFEFPPIGNTTYRGVAPDNSWTFTENSVNSVNLNSGGDQLYFMQGGIWNPGTGTVGNFLHNATYTGGRILFGFNTKTMWRSFDSSQDSGLHPDVASCYHMEPTSGSTDYIAFAGPFTPANQLEWVFRVANPANWKPYGSCANLPALPIKLDSAPNGINISCNNCQGCGKANSTLIFKLPATGGPFLVDYTNGKDTFQLPAALNGDTLHISTTTSVVYKLISVSDIRNCPIYSSFDGAAVITVFPAITALKPQPLVMCASPGVVAADFDLTKLNSQITPDPKVQIFYFRDSFLTDRITVPNQYNSTSDTIYATVSNGSCQTPAVPIVLQVQPTPVMTAKAKSAPCNDCTSIQVRFTGKPPFLFNYATTNGSNATFTGSTSISNLVDSFNICSPEFNMGNNNIRFLSLIDANRCATAPNITLQTLKLQPVQQSINRILCEGEKLVIRGVTYDEKRLTGIQTFPSKSPSQCDTTVEVSISYAKKPTASWRGDTTICKGKVTPLKINLPPGSPFNIKYLRNSDTILQNNVFNGQSIEVAPNLTTTYRLIAISAVNGDYCPAIVNSAVTIGVSTLSASSKPSLRFGQYEISCAGQQDGAAEVQTSGGLGKLNILWSNGASDKVLRNLGAGLYQVTVTDSIGCKALSSVRLNAPDSLRVTLGSDTVLCGGNPRALTIKSITGGASPYTVAFGEKPSRVITKFPVQFQVSSSGVGNIVVTDGNGCQQDQPYSLVASTDLVLDLGPDRIIDAGDSLVLAPKAINFSPTSIVWTPTNGFAGSNQLKVAVTPTVSSVYQLTLKSKEGCSITDLIAVTVQKRLRVYIPNAFAPTDDGPNRIFSVYPGPEVVQVRTLKVFDRWGELVYQGANLTNTEGWDGRFRGEAAPMGTYVYVVEVELKDGRKEVLKGGVTLLR